MTEYHCLALESVTVNSEVKAVLHQIEHEQARLGLLWGLAACHPSQEQHRVHMQQKGLCTASASASILEHRSAAEVHAKFQPAKLLAILKASSATLAFETSVILTTRPHASLLTLCLRMCRVTGVDTSAANRLVSFAAKLFRFVEDFDFEREAAVLRMLQDMPHVSGYIGSGTSLLTNDYDEAQAVRFIIMR